MQPSPPGTIVSWAGAIVNIPSGWFLCDGNNGTPDLRDRFVVGSGNTYAVGETGGSVNHNHDFESAQHTHFLPSNSVFETETNFADETGPARGIGTTDVGSSLSPYYSLAFIMYGG